MRSNATRRGRITVRDDDARALCAEARACATRQRRRIDAVLSATPRDTDLPTARGKLVPTTIARSLLPGTWARLGVEGTGSCFYESVAALLDLRNYWTLDERARATLAHAFRCALATEATEAAVAAVTSESGDTTAPTDSGIVDLDGMSAADASTVMARQLCTPTAWADEPDIRLTLRALHINIVFVNSSKGSRPFCGVKFRPDRPTGVILWCNDERHFEPLVRIEGGQVLTMMRPADAVLAKVVRAATLACA